VATASRNGGVLERPYVALATLFLALGGCGRDAAPAHAVPGDRGGPTIVVEVLNASGRPGNARVGTRVLRRAGIDVVYFGNAPATLGIIDSTRIIVRRGSASVGDRVRQALGRGRVEVQPDSARLLDASVLLGADFAPRQDFHP
jgi:hypothetical protein